MSRFRLVSVWLIVLAMGLVSSVTHAALITDISRGGSSTNLAPQIAGPLGEGSLCFVDRTATTHGPGGHQYKDLPAYLLGADYVMTANNDRTVADFTLGVTLSQPATVYLLIDNRVGDGAKENPPTLGGGVMDWVGTAGFVATGDVVSIDEKGDGTIENYSSVYSLNVAAGTITLYQQNAGSLNMYGVAAIPEPATIALLGLGGLALLGRRKRS